MATPEGKPESEQDSKPETKAESKEVEENNQLPPLKYKAWVLKVSIHCEGCRRKVEKTLRKIDGVYEAFADLKQQKATVKAKLHVDAEVLIKQLKKKGRHAALWPEKAEQKEKKQNKSKNKDKQQSDHQANNDQEDNNKNNNHTNGGDKGKETVKIEAIIHPESVGKSFENGSSDKNAAGGCNINKANEGGAPGRSGGQVKEVKPENKRTVTVVDGNQSPVSEKKDGGEGVDGDDNVFGEKSGGGGGSKKSKRKGQKGNANANIDEGEHSGDAGPAYIGSNFPAYGPHGCAPLPSPASHSPPRQQIFYEYPTYYHAPPVYVTSYNTAYPRNYSTTSYYASPPPDSYAYMHPGPAMSEHPPSNMGIYSSQPSDSFEMFSDENPNACSIM